MPPQTLKIATRGSQLALKQSELVKNALEKHYPELKIEFVLLTTSGDKQLDHPLYLSGGKGLFTKEIEEALLENRADIAVHSMKDMPVQVTKDLEIAAYLEREDPRDVLVANHYTHLSEIPAGKKIGTASLRRQYMVTTLRPDLRVETLRGNVNTRLSKLDAGEFDAIILAAAGLKRLNFTDRIKYYFLIEESLPAIGQGIIGIQCRSDDEKIKSLLRIIDHTPTRLCILAERAMNALLGGNCHSPIGGHATIEDEILHLRGWLYSSDGTKCFKSKASGHINEIEKVATWVGNELLSHTLPQ